MLLSHFTGRLLGKKNQYAAIRHQFEPVLSLYLKKLLYHWNMFVLVFSFKEDEEEHLVVYKSQFYPSVLLLFVFH